MSPDKVFFILVQSKAKFLNQFTNDNLKSQADAVWRQLEGVTHWLVILMVVLGIGLAAYYYKPYNEQPGRHYRVSHWFGFGLIAIALTFAGTLCTEYLLIKTNLRDNISSLYMMVALNNAIYCAIVYGITSVVWWNFFPTNAYRAFRIFAK